MKPRPYTVALAAVSAENVEAGLRGEESTENEDVEAAHASVVGNYFE